MSNLIVMSFKDTGSAGQFLGELGQLQSQKLIKLDDAATVVRTQDGKVKVKQARSLVGEGALGGAFWGMLIGLLFLVPFFGLAVGAATGALAGKFSDYGIDDEFIKDLSEQLQPGTSAIFVLVHDAQPDRVIDQLKKFNGEIIHTSLSNEQESQLKEAFSAA
jgi:uncharacterized membrane protein